MRVSASSYWRFGTGVGRVRTQARGFPAQQVMPLPYRIEWLEEATADVRRLDRPTAMRIFEGILHYARTGGGNVEPLHADDRLIPPPAG